MRLEEIVVIILVHIAYFSLDLSLPDMPRFDQLYLKKRTEAIVGLVLAKLS